MKVSFVLPLLLLGAAGHTSIAMAQSPGTFTATGDMTAPRFGHTATLLPNGKVLIAGGGGGNTAPLSFTLASAELYDPSTGTFTPTGEMATPRAGQTATLLADGRVLVTGGAPTYGSGLASAELYDPSTGTFTAAGSMTAARVGHSASLLPDGRVLIAGGHKINGPLATDAELYDPSTGTFTGIGTLDDGDDWFSTTSLADGRVLIVGISAHLYDPGAGTLSPISVNIDTFGQFPRPKATLLMNGKVLFAGGNGCDGDFDGAELYDPSTGIFTATGNMGVRRAEQSLTLVPDGTVLIAGSIEDDGRTLVSAELYDPVTGTFSNTGNMATDRAIHTATLLNDGSVLIAGGIQAISPLPSGVSVAPLSSAEIYHPPVLTPAPVLLSLSGDGRGQGAILHASTQQVVSTDNPAVAGEALEIFLTGLNDGSVIPPRVAIGGRMAEILFFGKAPGFAGLNQVNVRVPSGVVPGPAVPVRLHYIGRPSNEVTIGVQRAVIKVS
jgi:hypothetical protein